MEYNAEIYKNGINDRLYFDTGPCQDFLLSAFQKWGSVGVSLSKPINEKSLRQLRAVHGMINEWYLSGQHSAPETASDGILFRERVKSECGVVLSMPEGIEDLPYKFQWMCKVLKSVARYNDIEMNNFTNNVMSRIDESMKPLTWKMEEIFKGMGAI